MNLSEGIAIVGMDCRYPGAHTIEEYWENILSLRQQFRRIPKSRLNLAHYYSSDQSLVDFTYSQQAAVLSGYHFDRVRYRIGQSTFEQADLTHWLALDVAAGALRDAGFENGKGLDKKRVGVILGNSLTGEFTRANVMRLRWPYVNTVLASSLKSLQYSDEAILTILSHTETLYKSPFPQPDADTLAGGLSNTIAGRICNYFNFNGGGFTTDGACASSLLAFTSGCNALLNGDIDTVLVGGVDLSIDPFEIIGFARNGALAKKEMEVYSTKPEGFWPGEGCGVVVLMRESEARERNVRIYSVIRGWGISSDGNGGMTRPKSETQQLAFARAYARAGYNIGQVTMFEGHGTGTPLGDQVEINALVSSIKEVGKKGAPAFLGSVKNLIGHTKAAAGIAGVIKAALSLKNTLIPPFRLNTPHGLLKENQALIQLNKQPLLYTGNDPMRASISSMGFGGINVHLTMEEASLTKRVKKMPGKVTKLAHSVRNCEIFPLSASSKEGLIQQVTRLTTLAKEISRSELIDISASLSASFQSNGSWRACLVACTPDHLVENLEALAEAIVEGKTRIIQAEKGIFFDATGQPGKIAFLFPGQGSPVYPNAGAFSPYVPATSTVVTSPGPSQLGIVDTEIAQPAIIQQTLHALALLEVMGVEAHWGIGHSLGEIAALCWAGAMSAERAVELASIRGMAMSTLGEKEGVMLALRCQHEQLMELISGKEVWITGYNGPNNYVIGGHQKEIALIQALASLKQMPVVQLPVSHAFHTPMMKKAAAFFIESLKTWQFNSLNKAVCSTVTGYPLAPTVDIHQLLFTQIEQPVLLTQAITQVRSQADLFIEVGPGTTLTRSLATEKGLDVVALDYGSDSLKGFLSVLSAAYVLGNVVQFDELSYHRFYRPLDITTWKLDVFANPCEEFQTTISDLKAKPTASLTQKDNTVFSQVSEASAPATPESIASFIKKIISEKTEIPVELIGNEDTILSQLHLNSLVITEIISLVIKTFNKSQKVFSAASIMANADSSIEILSQLIYSGENGESTNSEKEILSFELIENWTHIFQRTNTVKKASSILQQGQPGMLLVSGIPSLAKEWHVLFNGLSLPIGKGSLFVYSSDIGKEMVESFLAFLNTPTVRAGEFLYLITLSSNIFTGDLKPILKTFQQEAPHMRMVSVEIDSSLPDKEQLVLSEIKIAHTYKEIQYTVDGLRSESELFPFFPKKGSLQATLTSEDVILATGGGKGITFESVFALASQTGAKLLLLGRSLPQQDSSLAKNLARIEAAGITYRYFSQDVCDTTGALEKAIHQGIAALGPVTMVLQGAGYNQPKTIQAVTLEDFQQIVSVKVGSLQRILESIETKDLKWVIGYGSIIAESGMHGNADYAWANHQLALYISQFGQAHPHCKCLTLEWSVWDEVGMGVTLNSLSSLKGKGVWPIPVKKGIETLQSIIADPAIANGNYIISGRYGSIPTLSYGRKRLPLGRFIAKVKHHIPSVEIVSDVNINLSDDLYLTNHVFQNQYVFPTVMILEGMAQVGGVVLEGTDFWSFKELKINQSIFISKESTTTLRFIATRLSEKCCKLVVQSEGSNFGVNCFEAILDLETTPRFSRDEIASMYQPNLLFEVESKFYNDLLFHKGPFRRIQSFKKISALGSVAIAESNMTDAWFGEFILPQYVLGDPGLNDASIHCHQACRPGNSLLPSGAKEVTINAKQVQGPFFVITEEKREIGACTWIDVCVCNAQGEVKLFWKDLVLTQVTGTTFKGEWDPHLLSAYIEYHFNKISKASDHQIPVIQSSLLLNSLASPDNSAELTVNGYTIALRKKAEMPSNSALAGVSEYFTTELTIANIKDRMLLTISQQ